MAVKPLVTSPAAGMGFVEQVSPNMPFTLTAPGFRTVSDIVKAVNGATSSGFAQVTLGNGVTFSAGNKSPNGILAGQIGDLCVSSLGGAGATFFVKESGIGTPDGWVGK